MVKTPPSKPYSINEKILCDHQGMMYEAKILDIKTVDGETQYLVHYQGWNNRWDEWVGDDRLYEYTDENLKKQQELATKVAASGGKTGSGGSQRGRTSQGGAEATSGKLKTPGTGGKSKATTGSSGPSTPFDGSSAKTGGSIGLGESAGGGLELESRASTPSIDGSASVASTSTTGQASAPQPASTKRKGGGKSKGSTAGSVAGTPAPDNVTTPGPDPPETPASAEPKRKRARQSAPIAGQATAAAMQPPTGTTTTIPSDMANPAPGVESFDQFRGRQEVQVKMPDDLKEVIVDDWDLITRQDKLLKLPASKTIEDILTDYAKHKANQKGLPNGKQNHARDTVEGVRKYFNEMCGVHLLYKYERPQYNDILEQQQQDENEDSMSSADDGSSAKRRARLTSFYGFPHLLRLCVRMGQMLAYTDLDQKSIDAILAWIQEFLKFLSKHKTTYYRTDDYFVPPAEYRRKAYAN